MEWSLAEKVAGGLAVGLLLAFIALLCLYGDRVPECLEWREVPGFTCLKTSYALDCQPKHECVRWSNQ